MLEEDTSAALHDVGCGVLRVHLAGSKLGPGADFDDLRAFNSRCQSLSDYKLCRVNVGVESRQFWTQIRHIQSNHVPLEALNEVQCGESGGALRFWTTLMLDETEYITGVSGTWGYIIGASGELTSIEKLVFYTSEGRSVPLGTMDVLPQRSRGGCPFDFRAPPDHCITGFWGRVGCNLNMLGVYLTKIMPFEWSEDKHGLFPPSFKNRVRSFLLVCKRHNIKNWKKAHEQHDQRLPFLNDLPGAALHRIFKNLCDVTYCANQS